MIRHSGTGRPAPKASVTLQDSISLAQAHRTLRRATRFFEAEFGPRGWDGRPLHAKVLGNALRELDRFLSVLLDELLRQSGMEADEVRRLERVRNTPGKLAAACDWLGLPRPDLERWRALGRCRDCLFHTAGIVRRPDVRAGTVMTMAWPARGGRADVVALGGRLPVTPADLAWICGLYDSLARDLVGAGMALPLPELPG